MEQVILLVLMVHLVRVFQHVNKVNVQIILTEDCTVEIMLNLLARDFFLQGFNFGEQYIFLHKNNEEKK